MANLKSVGIYSQGLNTGVEYAIREDGAVFSRNKIWNDHFRAFTSSKWQRDAYWEETSQFSDLPERTEIGFGLNGLHYFSKTARLRLPQEAK